MRCKNRKGQSGQTALEYLLLLSAAFITAYIMITGPVANFTGGMLQEIRNNIVNIVRNGENDGNQELNFGDNGHPGDQARFEPLHM